MTLIIIYGVLFIACLIALIVLIVKTATKKKNSSDSATTTSTALKDKSVLELIPLDCYEDSMDCFRLRDGTLMDLVQVRSKDLLNESRDAVEYDILKFTKLYKKFDGDLKIVIINFPTSTTRQQEYTRYKIEHTKNEIHKKWLQKSLNELIWLEENRTTREFFYMFWGKDDDELFKRRDIIFSILGCSKDGLLLPNLEKEKKIAILRKLNNKNIHIMKRGER